MTHGLLRSILFSFLAFQGFTVSVIDSSLILLWWDSTLYNFSSTLAETCFMAQAMVYLGLCSVGNCKQKGIFCWGCEDCSINVDNILLVDNSVSSSVFILISHLVVLWIIEEYWNFQLWIYFIFDYVAIINRILWLIVFLKSLFLIFKDVTRFFTFVLYPVNFCIFLIVLIVLLITALDSLSKSSFHMQSTNILTFSIPLHTIFLLLTLAKNSGKY